MRSLTWLAMAGLCMAGPAAASDAAMIQGLDDAFSAAAARGDSEAIAKMYAPDATILPQGAGKVSGRDGAKTLFAGMLTQVASVKLTVGEVKRLGPTFIQEIGTSALEMKADPGHSIAGKYVVIWRKVGSEWKLWTDIWN